MRAQLDNLNSSSVLSDCRPDSDTHPDVASCLVEAQFDHVEIAWSTWAKPRCQDGVRLQRIWPSASAGLVVESLQALLPPSEEPYDADKTSFRRRIQAVGGDLLSSTQPQIV